MKFRIINYKFSILIIVILIAFSCKRESNSFTKNHIWEKFKTGIENKDLTYLLNNSLDSIKCIDCILTENNILHSSQLVFEKHLIKLYNSEILKGKEYFVYETDSIIRINYRFKQSFKNKSGNIIYMFDKTETKYLFTGMITVP